MRVLVQTNWGAAHQMTGPAARRLLISVRMTDSVPLLGSAVPEPASSSVPRESLVSALPTVPTPKPQAPGLVGTSQTHPSSCIAVKPGKCPVDRLRCLSPTKHTCNKDTDCSGKKRCCISACGRDCRDPSKGAVSDSLPPPPARVCPSRSIISAGYLPQK